MSEPARHPIVIDSAGGEYMESVVVVGWAAAPGDAVKKGQTIVTVETAKAATEIAATHDGYLAEIVFAAGSEAPVGSVLGFLTDVPVPVVPRQTISAPAPAVEARGKNGVPSESPPRVIASPYARRLAAERGVELEALSGSGPGGRIKSRDLPQASSQRAPAPAAPHHPIVLLHGFGADQSIWSWVRPLLQVPNPVVAIDLPGHGRVPMPPVAAIAAMAEDVASEISSRGIADVHVVGHSLGGAVALALTASPRLRIHSLALLAPASLGPEIDVKPLQGLLAAQTPAELQPSLARLVAAPGRLPANFASAALWQRAQAAREAEQGKLLRDLFPRGAQAERFLSNLKAIRVPAKLIWGKADAIIPVAHAAQAPGAMALHLLDDIGHLPQIECPDMVARLIDELVRSTGH